jgi:hypothetical protein
MAAITRQDTAASCDELQFFVDWVKVTDTFHTIQGAAALSTRAAGGQTRQIADVWPILNIHIRISESGGLLTLLGATSSFGQPIGVLFPGRKNVELFTHQRSSLFNFGSSSDRDRERAAIRRCRRVQKITRTFQQQTAADVLKSSAAQPSTANCARHPG